MPLLAGKNYYVRSRHRTLNGKISSWSPGSLFKTVFSPTTANKYVPTNLVAGSAFPTQLEGSSDNYNFAAGQDETDGGRLMFYRKTSGSGTHNLTKIESRPAGTTDMRQFGKVVCMSSNGYWIFTAQRNPTTHQLRLNFYEYGAGSTWNYSGGVTLQLTTNAEATSIAIHSSGSYIVLGTPYSDGGKGQIHIFERTGPTTAVHRQTINNPNPTENSNFGYRVSVPNGFGRVLASAPGGPGAGSVYIFSLPTMTTNTLVKRLQGSTESNFGRSLHLSRNNTGLRCLVGARTPGQPGKVYMYSQGTGDAWDLTTTLQAPTPTNGDNFGVSVSISADGGRVLVGSVPDDNGNGSVCAITQIGGVWTVVKVIVPSDSHDGDKFGACLWISETGLEIDIGAPGNNNAQGNGAGAVYRVLWSNL